MNCCLFSVIIPIYNVEAYIRQCIESVLKQTYKNIEVILVDDGATDNCPIICDEYAKSDHRIKVIHKKNGGLVSARKAGANIASGDYIVCVDGDDWVNEEYVAKFAEVMAEHKPDIIVCGYVKSDGEKNKRKVLPYRKGYYSRENIIDEIFPILIQGKATQYFSPSIWAKAYKAELYITYQNKVDNRIKIGEDAACVIPCIYRAESMFIIDDCNYYYRQNLNSMTKERKAFDFQGPKLIAEHLSLNVDMDKYDFQSQLYLKTAHELFTVLLSQFNRTEKYKNIKKDIRCWLADPIYSNSVRNAGFIGVKGRIASLVMRFKLYRIMQLMNEIRRLKWN